MNISVVIPLLNEEESLKNYTIGLQKLCNPIIIRMKYFLLMMVVQIIHGK